jgi:hypothetical protein
MPFDSQETAPFDPLTFSPGDEGLRKLAWVLRHPEVWPKGHVWDFSKILTHVPCGTVGCAMGIARRMWPRAIGSACSGSLARAFDLDETDMVDIFVGPSSRFYSRAALIDIDGLTPLDVADAIHRYLAARARG